MRNVLVSLCVWQVQTEQVVALNIGINEQVNKDKIQYGVLVSFMKAFLSVKVVKYSISICWM